MNRALKKEQEDRYARIAALARKDAEALRVSAGYGGHMHDGGGGALLALVDVWMAGLVGQVPTAFSKYEIQERQESDPEYKEYLRMKRKFG